MAVTGKFREARGKDLWTDREREGVRKESEALYLRYKRINTR